MNFKKYIITDQTLFPIIFSKKLTQILKKINDKVSNELLNLSKNNIKAKETFIDITAEIDVISFMSSEKVNKMILDKENDIEEKCWNDNRRINNKIGRFIYKLLKDKVTDIDIEKFINKYKSIVKLKKINRNFKLVEGEMIKKWYLLDNYSDGGGNLKNSCMRYKFAQNFLNIYSDNPEKIKLLILLDESKEKILGRSLIWKLDIPEDRFFMDRIYFSDDYVLNMFINFAINRDWFYKPENLENVLQVLNNNKIINQNMVVNIKKIKYESYPFVDNLGFYDPISSTLTNNPIIFKKMGRDKYYDLSDTLGEFEIRNDFDF